MQGRLFATDGWARLPDAVDDDERVHAVALSLVSSPAGSGMRRGILCRMPSELYHVVEGYGTPETLFNCAGAYPGTPLEAARRIMERLAKESIRALTIWDREYPPLLREIPFPPLVLYVIGECAASCGVAIVGTRKADPRSAAIARRLGQDLAGSGFAVVSGMALGIDREAHLGALDAGGVTIGVLPGGIDIVYPWSNRDLYRRIRETAGSGLISEYPPGINISRPWTFAQRNRIISGLCAGTVVVKAAERSGALITARHALEQNREVFACAGHSFDGEYAGCNRLIRDGAILVSSTQDIVDGLGRPLMARVPIPRPAPGDVAEERQDPGSCAGRILRLLADSEHEVDELIRATGGSTGEVQEAIIQLELEGKIFRNGNMISKL
jgi:DNA processing protein